MKKIISLKVDKQFEDSLSKNHPWIFSKKFANFKIRLKLSSVIQFLSKKSRFLAYGIFCGKDKLVSVRVLPFGQNFTRLQFLDFLISRFEERISLLEHTDSLRLLHGENDGLPGLTLDYHAGTLMFRCYDESLLLYVRFVSRAVFEVLNTRKDLHLLANNILLMNPRRTSNSSGNYKKEIRVLRGSLPETILIRYRDLKYSIRPGQQKGGIYNDIRNLRDFISENPNLYTGKSVLNLFSNNGLLSELFLQNGAESVHSIEDSQECIEVHKKNLKNPEKSIIQKLDIFRNYQKFSQEAQKKYDWIIIDPPSLTASGKDVHRAKVIYKKLIEISLGILSEEGILVVCSCSNRIHRNEFENIVGKAFS